jgi:hypothetical protein
MYIQGGLDGSDRHGLDNQCSTAGKGRDFLSYATASRKAVDPLSEVPSIFML